MAHHPSFGTHPGQSSLNTEKKQLVARVNCFELTLPDRPLLFTVYDVAFEPDIKSTRRKKEIMAHVQIVERPDLFSGSLCLYDGQFIFARPALQLGEPRKKLEVKNLRGRKPLTIFISDAEVSQINLDELTEAMRGHISSILSTTAVRLLNIIIQHAASLKYPSATTTRNSIYMDDDRITKSGLEIWRGFFQSVRISQNRLLVNVDIATGLMYRRGPLIEVVQELLGLRNARALNSFRRDTREFVGLKSILNSVRVRQKRRDKPERVHVIHGIVPNAGAYEFTLDNGDVTTVEEHFFKTSGLRLTFPGFPGIKTKRGAVIPFELCEVLSGNFYRKPLTEEMATNVLAFATVKPDKRFNMITDGIQNLGYSSTYLNQLGIRISTRPLDITGRLLRSPPIRYANNSLVDPSDGSWNLVGKRFVEPRVIRGWAVICFDSVRISKDEVESFISQLISCMVNLGMGKKSNPELSAGNPQGDIPAQLHQAGQKAIVTSGQRLDLIIAIIPPNSAVLRHAIKRFGDISRGIPTQCVRSDKMPKEVSGRSNQYCNNLLTKINTKLGGVCSYLHPHALAWVKRAPTMVVGADVSHPSPGVQRPSVAGLVGSVDEEASRYVSTCTAQMPRLEIIADLKNMMKTLFCDFHDYWVIHKKDIWPAQILFYRDGVSEGEMGKVLSQELNQIIDAANEIPEWRGAPPKVTFIVVGKRHHIRFAPRNKQEGDKTGNCPAGFVVDNTITYPESSFNHRDFFLQSQAGLLGTSRPAHYILLHDDNNFDIKSLESLSFALCHVYARATRSVSIPAPVYYADIVCQRADFHFDPGLMAEVDATSSGSFNLKEWMSSFKDASKSQRYNMYFM